MWNIYIYLFNSDMNNMHTFIEIYYSDIIWNVYFAIILKAPILCFYVTL